MDAEQIAHFSEHGWALFHDVIDADTITRAQQRLGALYPTFEQYANEPSRYEFVGDGQFGGLRLWPVDDLFLDLLPLDDRVVALVEQLVGTTEISLLRAGYQAKYAGTADFDQVLHVDYPNHSLVIPHDDDIVGFFLYIADVTDDLGPTALVSRRTSGAADPAHTHLTPEQRPDFYAAETRASGPAGSVLAYRSTTYHRATAITASSGVRLTLSYAYSRPAPWTGYASFPRLGEDSGLVRAVARMTPAQRALIGFPAIGDPFWTAETLDAVAERYEGFDVSAYLPGT